MRIASLLPSATEIVCALGARDELVGVSHECDHPPGVEELPVLTRPRRSMPPRSGEIDRVVREMVLEALAVYEVDLERLREVRPDVIVTQDLCDVCAVSLDDVRQALAELAREDVILASCRPLRLAEVWEDVRSVGKALGRAEVGASVAVELEERCAEVARRAAVAPSRPTVLTIEWLDPVMVGGLWTPEIVELAGGRPLVASPGEKAPTVTFEQLEALDPDAVLVKPCGYDLEHTRAEIQLVREKLPWEKWSAVTEGRVFVADGSAYFNRPGPRLVESLEILAACLHPEKLPDLAERHDGAVRRVGPDLGFESVLR